jgi:hypothetical protein
MGSDAAAVLDPELRVRGTRALRVVAITWRASELIMQARGGAE